MEKVYVKKILCYQSLSIVSNKTLPKRTDSRNSSVEEGVKTVPLSYSHLTMQFPSTKSSSQKYVHFQVSKHDQYFSNIEHLIFTLNI